MTALDRAYRVLIDAMAVISGGVLVWLMVSVVLSVGMRNAGIQPFAWLFTSALPERPRRILSRCVAALCVVVCALLAWKGADLLLTNIERNDFDVRAYFYPRWLLTITFPISFGLMAVEFARFVVGEEIMHTGEAGIHE